MNVMCGDAVHTDDCIGQYKVSISVCVILHVCVITQDGDSALIRAAVKGKTEVVIELVKAGANVDKQNEVCQYNYCCRTRILV